ncbi:YibE/F family protein [Nocardioides flavescens]|uniref:YibE/F family protein n=1 Tax=Nocardioides flavescens TaxID=2691959 RepID=UPI00301B8840
MELHLDPVPRAVLLVALAAVAIATLAGLAWLWPDGKAADDLHGSVQFAAEGATFPEAVVDRVRPACPPVDPSDPGGSGGSADRSGCGTVTATVAEGAGDGDQVTVDVPPEVATSGLAKGDRIQLLRTPTVEGQDPTYGYFGISRATPLWLVAGLFALVVLVVARWRGLMAIVGLGFAALVVGFFAIPALITGEQPVAVALVTGALIMFVVLYTTHGFSMRTSAALGGTLVGMLLIAGISWWAIGAAHLTGVVDQSGQALTTFAPGLQMQDLLVAAVVIAGLGILNDVTITQASAVWELRAASPAMSRARLFTSGMRIGRDHIASTIYTIVFAYAGTALTLLLAVSLYDRSWWELLTTEEISEEIVRALTGSIGLVLAVPATTAVAVLTVPGPRGSLDP